MTNRKIAARTVFNAGRYLHRDYQQAKRLEHMHAICDAMNILADCYNAILGERHVPRTQPLQR